MRFFIALRYILLFAFFLLVSGVFARDYFSLKSADSLKNILKTQVLTPKQKLETYHKIIVGYALFTIDSVIVYAPPTIRLAEELDERRIAIDCCSHLGAAYCFRENYDSAFVYFEKMREINKAVKDSELESNSISLMAFAYARQGKYITAIDYYLKVLSMYEKTNLDGRVKVLTNLGELNRKINNSEVAIRYLDEAMDVCDELDKSGLPVYKVRYQWRILHILNEYANTYLEQGNLNKALNYALKFNQFDSKNSIINLCENKMVLAKIYLQQHNYDQALYYAKEAGQQADILKDNVLYVDLWKILSDIYLAQNRYFEAEIQALKAWQTDSTDIDGSRSVLANIAMANLYMNHPEKAAYYLGKYSEMSKQYSKKSFQITMSDMEVKYEIDKKEIQIASLNRQRILYVSIAIVGILLAIAVWIVYRQKIRRERQKKQLIAAHAAFEGEIKERERLARDLHDGLGGMLSSVKIELNDLSHLHNIRDRLDSCIEELRRVARDLMPVPLFRFGMRMALENFCCSFPNVHFYFFGEDKRVDKKIEIVVYFCTQELVNNSVRHSGAKNINVQLIQDDKHISLTVQDDGCGFQKELIIEGNGLKNIHDRVAAFNGKVDIITSLGHGTETNIELKIETV